MKYFISLNSILIFVTVLSAKSNLIVGMKAPEFELPDQDRAIHKLTDYRGTTVVLYFFPMADTPG